MEQVAFGIVDIQEFYDLEVKLVSTELNHIEMIAFLFPQIYHGARLVTGTSAAKPDLFLLVEPNFGPKIEVESGWVGPQGWKIGPVWSG